MGEKKTRLGFVGDLNTSYLSVSYKVFIRTEEGMKGNVQGKFWIRKLLK